MIGGMKKISATTFKQQRLALFDEVGPDGIVITKHGKPVAKLVPIERDFAELIGCMKGRIKIHEDILSTGLKWDAESGHTYRAVRHRRRAHGPRKKNSKR